MRKILLGFAVAALMCGVGGTGADAQTSRGAATIPLAAQNYTPIEKAACGPHRGRWCGPFHHRVCGPRGRCWCAPC
jgi:hypothetical protein